MIEDKPETVIDILDLVFEFEDVYGSRGVFNNYFVGKSKLANNLMMPLKAWYVVPRVSGIMVFDSGRKMWAFSIMRNPVSKTNYCVSEENVTMALNAIRERGGFVSDTMEGDLISSFGSIVCDVQLFVRRNKDDESGTIYDVRIREKNGKYIPYIGGAHWGKDVDSDEVKDGVPVTLSPMDFSRERNMSGSSWFVQDLVNSKVIQGELPAAVLEQFNKTLFLKNV